MKRRMLSIAMCSLLSMSCVGAAVTTVQADEDVTLTFMASQDWIYDAEMELAEKFEEETGIHIDFQIVPSDQYYNLLMTKLNSGEGPDIFGGQSGSYDLVSQYNITENAVDLSDEEWVSYYNEFAKEQTSVDGVVYGSTYFDTTTDFYMVYNKKIFEEYGLEIPKSFEEFEQVCQTLLDNDVIPFYEPAADGWHHVMWFCEIGGKYSDLDPDIVDKLNNNEVKFADTEMFKTTMDQINDMAQKGYFGDNYLSDEYADLASNLGSGEYAMTMAKAGTINEIADASDTYTADDFGLFLIPTLDNDVLNVHPCGPTRFIYSGSSHIEEAKKYLAYMTTQDSIQYMIDNEAKIDNLPYDINQTPAYTQTTTDFLAANEAKQGVVFQDVIKYLNPQWFEIGQDMVSMFIGDMTSEEVLQKIDDRRESQATANGDEAWLEESESSSAEN